ncbi:DUF423 domain-containing protein [Listeria sp. PSOL-1]|uniref:DUF423 domain-containing protein n=1 Tax=Listeria sp. PSOL-1 TaxID=1844999 RepID=UPI0013D3717C|nr:DUF423 domain-containing protein [Listeria sp. PSOL-1]
MKKVLTIGGIFGLLAVLLGAFGSHGLKSVLGSSVGVWETAVHYQMFHAIVLLVTGILLALTKSKLYLAAAWFFSIGIILFSGSLYLLSTLKITMLGPVTPFGGVAFIAGWLCFIIGTLKQNNFFQKY